MMNTNTDKTLRKLFLTVFLRGHTSFGISKESAPKSVSQKLGTTLFLYGIIGLFAGFLVGQPTWLLSTYLHGQTLLIVGMFVTASAGEILFNKEESEILMHRPVTSRSLLVAKMSVLVLVSLYLAGAMNLAGFFIGAISSGNWLFPIAHALSCIEVAVFCAASVVLVYQLCLKWFGRERLEGLMTMSQVVLMIGLMLGSQLLPRMVVAMGQVKAAPAWWVNLLPPAWFAGLDDAIAGSHSIISWSLAGIGFSVSALAAWLAFIKLGGFYEKGMQTLLEGPARKESERMQQRLIQKIAITPPASWFLQGLVERASFVLVGAYMYRNREVKLRLYPGVVPFLVMPFILGLSFRELHRISFVSYLGPAIGGAYMGIVPLMAQSMLKYSQDWRAAEVFQFTPTEGPWRIHRGSQIAVLALLVAPMYLLVAAYFAITGGLIALALLLPGMMLALVYTLLPAAVEQTLPLSKPAEEARTTSRGLVMTAASFLAIGVGLIAAFAWTTGIYYYFLAAETLAVVVLSWLVNSYLKGVSWQPVN